MGLETRSPMRAYTLRFIQLVATNVITRLGARCDMEGAAPIGAYFPALRVLDLVV